MPPLLVPATALRSYIALGWAALPFLRQFHRALAPADVALIVAGGIIYSVGVSWEPSSGGRRRTRGCAAL